MLLIVTGEIGSGKSTVCRRVTDIVKSRGCACGGILSLRGSQHGQIVIEDLQTGEQVSFASSNHEHTGLRAGQYCFSSDGIVFGRTAIQRGIDLPLLVIDELGPLELDGNGFFDAISLINTQKTNDQLVVIRRSLLSSFLPLFDQVAFIAETKADNRSQIPHEILQVLFRSSYVKESISWQIS